MDVQDIVSLVGSIGSATALVGGILSQYVLAIPVGAIILTASLSFFLANQNQKANRKYEKRRLAVTEVLGPLHGDLLKIVEAFEYAESNKKVFYYSSTIWEAIVHSHRVFLIDKNLQEDLSAFYLDLFSFNRLGINHEISRVAAKVLEPFLGNRPLRNWPEFKIELDGGGSLAADFWGIVFWKVLPTVQTKGVLREVSVELSVPSGNSVEYRTFVGTEVQGFIEHQLKEIWDESDKDPKIIEARKSHQRLHSEVIRLKGIVEKEIKEWAK